MSDIVSFPSRGLTPAARDALETRAAAALHLVLAAGDIETLRQNMGALDALPAQIENLHRTLKEARLLRETKDELRLRPENIGRVQADRLSPVSAALRDTLRSLSSPAAVKRLFETHHDELLVAGGDILGAFNEAQGQRWNSSLAEQTAWLLSMEGRERAKSHLSFIDEEIDRHAGERNDAIRRLQKAAERKSEIDGIKENVSGALLQKTIKEQGTRLSTIHAQAIRNIDERVGEMAKREGNGPAAPLSGLMTDVVSHRSGVLCLSEFDYRRLPFEERQDLAERRLTHRLSPGEGLLGSYQGQRISDPSARELKECLAAGSAKPESRIRLAAIGANILRRNRIIIGGSAREAMVFFDAAKEALRERQTARQPAATPKRERLR